MPSLRLVWWNDVLVEIFKCHIEADGVSQSWAVESWRYGLSLVAQ